MLLFALLLFIPFVGPQKKGYKFYGYFYINSDRRLGDFRGGFSYLCINFSRA